MSSSILIIDDSKSVRERIAETLREAGLTDHVHHAGDGLEGFKKLMALRPALVLCDVVMPHVDGFRLLEMKEQRPELREIPVIMLTAQEDVDIKVRALEKGAVDYITKPFNPAELAARVRVHLQIKSLQDELRHANSMLEKLSITDGLTGLYNRRFLMEVLGREYSRSSRYGGNFAFILIDIDHFKKVNDLFGHQMGDEVLRDVARLMSNQLRTTDIIARYGGEEFAVVLPDTTLSGAEVLAERIREGVSGMPFKHEDSFTRITLSAGVVSYPSPGIGAVDDLIRLADKALYEAKAQGRNLVRLGRPVS